MSCNLMERLADEYRKSDVYDPDLHCDIFAIPVQEDGEMDSIYIKEALYGVYNEIRRYTGMSLDEAKEWFKDQEVETWFGESNTVNEKVYNTFFVRYDIPDKLVKQQYSEWQQGPSATIKESF
ncbi:hypothetical protein AVU32_gp220 [Vibrio phage ValKK3]|uniref:Uncharacterized protein n=1 Tax=Vibrio phage ValKK3 TaxID=1610855 RepID=A0A0D4DB69_9CAUD|nr:hypothetical protein AVU32_gp220 [Vibrio phage ValKK3]AJT61061.1 hypothetical protein [Vibrio phage ValKK3]